MTAQTSEPDAPAVAPTPPGDARRELAEEFLHGSGIEIGALHLAMWLPPGAHARYVDRMNVSDLRAHYPELADLDLAPVDIVDDGERLDTIPARSVDFIVANHFLEHCQDPITTITTHLTKLRPGGVLFYAVPDKRFTFDFRRPTTPLAHVIADHHDGPEHSRAQHYLEWASLVHQGTGPPSPAQAQAYADVLNRDDYSIHFHVWTQSDLLALLLHIHHELDTFEIETVRRNGIENIVVLRAHGHPAATTTPPRHHPGPPPATPPTRTLAGTRDRIPLAALRARRPAGDGTHWSIDPQGLLGRALVTPQGDAYAVPLVLERPVRLRARARLAPEDARDERRSARARVRIRLADGERRELWSAALRGRPGGGDDGGVAVDCELPPATVALELAVDAPPTGDVRPPSRVVWTEPSLIDPLAPTDPVVPASAEPVRAVRAPATAPRFSVLTPVHDPPVAMLREAIDSVLVQTLESWELCLVDDGSRDPAVTATLREYAAADARIHLIRHEHATGISRATNAAMELATGEFVALLDHDDLLVPNALELVDAALAADPEPDMVYSDEAVVANDAPTTRILKPAWAPESFASHMYTCHLGVYRRRLAVEIGGFRPDFDGCQDYDFALRFTERTDRVAHVPAQLYLWRAHTASTAGGAQAKPYAYLAQPRAISEHLRRLGVDAEVGFGAQPGMHRIVHRTDATTTVSVLLAAPRPDAAVAVAVSLAAQPHPAWEMVVGAPGGDHAAIVDALRVAGVDPGRIRLVDAPEGMAAGLQAAAEASRGDHLLLLERPAVGLTREWVTALLGYSARTGIGAAGGLVLGPDGRVSDAGYVFPEGIALALTNGEDGARASNVAVNVSAVAGAMMTAREGFQALGGLDVAAPDLALVDYGLRVISTSRRVVQVPDSRLALLAPDDRPNDLDGLWRLRRRLLVDRQGEGLYNPGLRADRGDHVVRSAT